MEKVLHVLKTQTDDDQNTLMRALSAGNQSLFFPLRNREDDETYEELIDLIFEYDKVIVWW